MRMLFSSECLPTPTQEVDANNNNKSKASRPVRDKHNTSVHKRRSIRPNMKGMRLDSFLQKSLERMDVGDHGWSGEMALVDGQSNREQLTKSSSQRLKRHELMDHSTRSSSQSKLVKTGSRSQRRLVRKTKSKNADEASIIVDGDIQDKCAKHTIVF